MALEREFEPKSSLNLFKVFYKGLQKEMSKSGIVKPSGKMDWRSVQREPLKKSQDINESIKDLIMDQEMENYFPPEEELENNDNILQFLKKNSARNSNVL